MTLIIIFKSAARLSIVIVIFIMIDIFSCSIADAAQIKAGVAKVNITDMGVPLINDTLLVKALVLDDGIKKAVIITLDAVSIGEIGYIKNDFLPKVRSALEKEMMIKPENILVNASYCHGIVCTNTDEKTIQAGLNRISYQIMHTNTSTKTC